MKYPVPMQIQSPDLGRFELVHGEKQQAHTRICIISFYSPIPGCLSSVPNILRIMKNTSLYVLVIALDTARKIRTLVNEPTDRGEMMSKLNIAIDSNNTLISFMNYIKQDRIPYIYLFDENNVMTWNGPLEDEAMKVRSEFNM